MKLGPLYLNATDDWAIGFATGVMVTLIAVGLILAGLILAT